MALEHSFDEITRRLEKELQDFSKPLKRFYVYILSETAQTFRKLGKRGSGSYRGVTWPWFKPVKIKTSAGIKTIPAEGIPGKYKGKLRASGQRVTANSRLMQDSGVMRKAALGKFRISAVELTADTPVNYANIQQKMRPFAFMTADDVVYLKQLIENHLKTMWG